MFDFFFKDATLYDSIVGMIGLTVVRRVADGVFAHGENTVNELVYPLDSLAYPVSSVNRINNHVPAVAPRLNRRSCH